MSEERAEKETVLSGIQPSGSLHIGNYVGALSLWVEQQEMYNSLFCVADLHALTMPEETDPQTLRSLARESAGLYLACGIDPGKSIVFLQSDVPEHAYLAWVLICCTPVGWLERMTQYKSKSAQTESVGAGLLTYPALQAADILIYKANLVPVGDDQKQHIELARDIAQRFNRLYDECFPLPRAFTRSSGARIMGLDDPSIKMSKSLANHRKGHSIALLDKPDTVRSTVMAAVTDSNNETRFQYASPGVYNLLVLYEALSGEPRAGIEERFAGKGYGYLKRELAELVIARLDPIQQRYRTITEDETQLDRVLAQGAEKARAMAAKTVAEVRALTGLGLPAPRPVPISA